MNFGRLRGVRRLSLTISLSVVAFLIIGAAITVAATVHAEKRPGPSSATVTHTKAGKAAKKHTTKHKRGGKDASGSTDYEFSGTGNDLGSFLLDTSSSTAEVEDLVVQTDISCADAPTPQNPTDVQIISGSFPVNAQGGFSGGKIVNGNGTTFTGTIASSGKLTLTYRHESATPNAFDGSYTTCDTGNVSLAGAPGTRQELPDGLWTGRVNDNPVTLRVVAGGRALQPSSNTLSPTGGLFGSAAFGAFTAGDGTAGATPTSNWNCGLNDPSAEFIAKNGTFGDAQWNDGDTYSSEGDGDDPYYTGTFTSGTSVSGSFWNGGEGCINDTWKASAPN